VAETFSIATCLATCYTYTDVLGPKLGLVPIVIRSSWFIMSYAGYVVVNLITEGFPISTLGSNLWIIGLSVATALVMTAWDLTLDPYMVNKEQAWLWQDGGAYFGIPFANYVSWVETTFIIVIIYRLWEREIPLRPMGNITPAFAAIPVLIYALMGLPDMFVGFPEATKVISPFAMGIPIVAAMARVWQLPKVTPPSTIETTIPASSTQPSQGSA
jgi:putative membrane protein